MRTANYRITAAFGLLAALVLGSSAALAGPRGHGPTEGEREELMERMRLVRLAAITEALELDEETAARLFPYLRSGDQKLQELHEERRERREALRELLRGESVDAAVVDEHVDALGRIEIQVATLRAEQVEGLSSILSPDQRATFVLVQARLEREVRRMIHEEHRRQRGEERRRGRAD